MTLRPNYMSIVDQRGNRFLKTLAAHGFVVIYLL